MTREADPEAVPRWTAATVYPDMWVDPDDDPRESVDEGSGEKSVLAAYLDRYRMTFEMKCDGLDAEQLARRSVPPSTMSLLGLVRHLAAVEHGWFRRFIEGQQDLPRLYRSPDDRDLDFNGAVADDEVVADAWESWRAEVRDVVVHMIEEYARHCGHADLLRECVDGRVGQ